jgi:hypothetical protein
MLATQVTLLENAGSCFQSVGSVTLRVQKGKGGMGQHTRPNMVFFLLRKSQASKVIKNWQLLVLGSF